MGLLPFARVRWVFFDLGNTLIDETSARRCFLRQITWRLQRERVPIQPLELERSLAAAFTRFSPDPLEHALTEFVQDTAMSRRILQETPYPKHLERPYPAALPLISILVDNGFRVGVIANQSLGTEACLVAYGLRHYFSCCFFSAEVGVAKPDFRIFRFAEGAAQCSADALLMIGDRLDNDIRPARDLGWATIRVLAGPAAGQRPRSFLDQADRSCTSLRTLAALLGTP